LMVGFLENNVAGGIVDGKYWPPPISEVVTTSNTDTSGPMEWFFVFDKDYSTSPDPTFQVDLSTTTVPMLIFGTPRRIDNTAWSSNDKFSLRAYRPPTNGDVWAFTPSKDVTLPPTWFDVSQNFPNPFNLSTTIRYTLPLRGRVTIKIYDILGRYVRTMLDQDQAGGVYSVPWNSAKDSGQEVASGVYFYRLTFAGDDASHTGFSTVKKMMVLK